MDGSSVRSRAAGQYARSKTRRYLSRAAAMLVLLAVVPVVAGLVAGFHNLAIIPIEVAAIASMFVLDCVATPIIMRWHRGALGEEHVGAIIDSLRPDGWLAIHDASTGRGNIDHVLVGPGGLFTVETKAHHGRIDPLRLDPRFLKQAYAEGKVVEGVTGLAVEPLLVFSHAYLIGCAVSRRNGVTILPARMLRRYLANGPQGIPSARVADVYARLAAALEPE